MPSEFSPVVARPWHPEWWIRDFGAEQRADCVERIKAGAIPDASYYVLIILSTLIASYGLLSNSTATVIGAMIVAPLMGPILGLAMGTVLGDTRMFRRSLTAEVSGVLLVVLTGILVAQVVGVSQIDFAASEIANRTRPTLYDLAIGLAAGLAGAFCLIHPKLQASVAGVAIAVALVPPLSVTGLTLAGWWAGDLHWRPAFGSFMLFLANFLTIELAAGLLFTAMGFRIQRHDEDKKEFRRAIAIQIVLLIATSVFLYGQLASLVRERIGLAASRKAVKTALLQIPGADLDDLKAELVGTELNVKAVVGSRTELTPNQVSEMQTKVQRALQERLSGVHVNLVARTVSSTYASASGFLYEPQNAPPSPEQVRSQQLEQSLRTLVGQYPGVELSGFQPLVTDKAPDQWPIEVTLRSPFVFTPRLVEELQTSLNDSLKQSKVFENKKVALLVRTVSVSAATASDTVAIDAPRTVSEERVQLLDRLISSAVSSHISQNLVQLSTRQIEGGTTDDTLHYTAKLQFEGQSMVEKGGLLEVRDEVVASFREQQGQSIVLELDVDSRLIKSLRITDDSKVASDGSTVLSDLVTIGRLAKVEIDESTLTASVLSPGVMRVEGTIYSEKFLPNSRILEWQKRLKEAHPELSSLELRFDNRLGRRLRLTPSR